MTRCDAVPIMTLRIDASWWAITNLTGLEHCTGLIELVLWGNNISDLSPLAGLTNLEYLDLDENQISDPSALAELANLQCLYPACLTRGANSLRHCERSAAISCAAKHLRTRDCRVAPLLAMTGRNSVFAWKRPVLARKPRLLLCLQKIRAAACEKSGLPEL